ASQNQTEVSRRAALQQTNRSSSSQVRQSRAHQSACWHSPCLLLLIAVITIVILLGLLASRSCDNGALRVGRAAVAQDIRLPKSLLPTSYQLLVRPVLPSQGQKTSVKLWSRKDDAKLLKANRRYHLPYRCQHPHLRPDCDGGPAARRSVQTALPQPGPALHQGQPTVHNRRTAQRVVEFRTREIEGDKLDGFYMAKYKDKNRALSDPRLAYKESVQHALGHLPDLGGHRAPTWWRMLYWPMDYVSLQKGGEKLAEALSQVGILGAFKARTEPADFAMSVTEKVLPYFEGPVSPVHPLPKLAHDRSAAVCRWRYGRTGASSSTRFLNAAVRSKLHNHH
uniref:Exostosin domain-containing protein n=1 Tax=Macrostomum lignano TaxID=282301 RepID=A0A1I8FPA0_9PLAT